MINQILLTGIFYILFLLDHLESQKYFKLFMAVVISRNNERYENSKMFFTLRFSPSFFFYFDRGNIYEVSDVFGDGILMTLFADKQSRSLEVII